MVDVAIVISIIAVSISLVSLWESHFSPFELKVTNTTPRLSIYKITPMQHGGDGKVDWIYERFFGNSEESEKVWWIPSFDLGVNLHNVGQKSGVVENIRISCQFQGGDDVYPFPAKYVVDPGKFQQHSHERFKWIYSATNHDWLPINLAGNDEKKIHIVLEGGRWDEKKTGILDATLEVKTDATDEWITVEEYEVHVFDDLYSGSTMVASEKSSELFHDHIDEEEIGWYSESPELERDGLS